MKISKRINAILSAVLSLAMLVSVFASAIAYAGEETAVVNEDAVGAYNFLKAVGAMDADEVPYDGEMMITRAHFVKMALHASNDAPKVLVSNDEVFYDVDMNTMYENYIETAYRIGYISGAANGLFEPESGITLAQATKILGNILGYEKIAEANGGYPGGYLIAAQRIDLLDGINLNDNEYLNMETAVLLLNNAVNCDFMQIVAIGEDTETKAYEDQTLLTERHKIYSAEGIIDSNSYTDLYAQESELEVGYVSVDGVSYKASNDIQDYIGYNVKLYYTESDNKAVKEAVWVELTEENTVIRANGRDLAVNGDDVEYYDDDGSKKIRFDEFVTYIVNGKMDVMNPEELESVTKGEIAFISNDGNKAVDVIKVTDYETFIVQGVSASSNLIITKDGVQMEFDPEDDDEYTFEIYKNSNPATVADIAIGDIILVSEGEGSGFVHKKVLASSRVISAEFDEIGDETAFMQGKEYYIDGINVSELKTGTTYEIKFDALGNISYVESGNEFVYGYLYGLAQSGMDAPKCRIFTENNRWVDLEFAKNVEFNGSKLPGEDVYARLKADEGFRQLIRYNVNQNAEVIEVQTAQEIAIGSRDADGDGVDEEALAIENDIFRYATITEKFCPTPKSFNGKCFVDAAAKIFVIPEDMDKEKFTILGRGVLTERTYQKLRAYDVNEYLNSAIFTMPDTVSNSKDFSSGDRALVVKSKGQVLDSDGNAVPSLKGWWTGIEMAFAVKIEEGYVDQAQYDSIGEGDVVYFKYDDNGNVTSITGVYTVRTPQPTFKDGGYYNAQVAFGKVEKCDFENSRLILTAQNGSQKGYMYNSKTGVYLWDCKEKDFRKASTAEFLADDIVVINMTYHNANEIVIIRNSEYQSE